MMDYRAQGSTQREVLFFFSLAEGFDVSYLCIDMGKGSDVSVVECLPQGVAYLELAPLLPTVHP